MATNDYSTVEFKSNLYPVVAEEILHDERFLHSLRDPFALQEFKTRAYRHFPSALQREILEKGVGVKCTYADPGDLAWGTIREDGIEQVVCLCEKYSCEHFSSCRPGVAKPVEEPLPSIEESVDTSFEPEEEFADFVEAVSDEGPVAVCAEEPVDERLELEEDKAVLDEVPQQIDEIDSLAIAQDSILPEEEDFEVTEDAFDANSEPEEDGLPIVEDEGVAGRYDARQAVIVCAEPSERLYVNAGPGAGKTHTLIEKIKYLMEEQGVEPDRITVLSFTRAAVSVVQNRLKSAAEKGQIHTLWQDVDVTTFDKLCTRLLYYVAEENGDEAEKKRISKLDYDPRIIRAKDLIASDHELMSGCDHLIVDETQDLVGPRADLVLEMIGALPETCGFTLFGDRCQSIYEYQVKDGGTTSGEFFEEVCRRFAPKQV